MDAVRAGSQRLYHNSVVYIGEVHLKDPSNVTYFCMIMLLTDVLLDPCRIVVETLESSDQK